MTRREQAMAYFKQGFNCSQSVLRAYSDLFDMPEDELMKAGQSFGGGMGRLRLVCGAVSGMFMVAGALTGSADPSDRESKKITMMWCRNWRLSLKRKRQSDLWPASGTGWRCVQGTS